MSKKQYFDYLIQTREGLKTAKCKVYEKDDRLLVVKQKSTYTLVDKATGLYILEKFYKTINEVDENYESGKKEYDDFVKTIHYERLCQINIWRKKDMKKSKR